MVGWRKVSLVAGDPQSPDSLHGAAWLPGPLDPLERGLTKGPLFATCPWRGEE